MTEKEIQRLLIDVRRGNLPLGRALERLRRLPFEDLGFAKIDHHRSLRQGYAEVIYAPGKRPEQVVSVVRRMMRNEHNILITRGTRALYRRVKRVARSARFHELSGAISIRKNSKVVGKGLILVISAGTSDIPVAEEALVTAEVLGNRAESLYDVGVAGLHRLMGHQQKLSAARVIICVAGMEGALPSVVGGLVRVPVIAVPTSVGYGASMSGVAALLAMLNSCVSNVAVVNIDNGFGAGCLASVINRL
ncbi:MAG: nickel pincer cofactor biosynthesis protein LarB [Acidobacteria bacterium]|nr:nickel pincer cofactor biosynthesis protein LarB [Acidobacteriota bacterium]